MVARGLKVSAGPLAVGRMSASAFRRTCQGPMCNAVRPGRGRIVDLAQRHRPFAMGRRDDLSEAAAGRPRHQSRCKRVDRLYTEARLQLKRRPRDARRSRSQPTASHWCAPSVATRSGPRTSSSIARRMQSSGGHEVPDQLSTTPPMRPWRSSRRGPSGGLPVTRALDRLAITARTSADDPGRHGPQREGGCETRAMLATWAHTQGLTLRLIAQPGKPAPERLHRVLQGTGASATMPERTWFSRPWPTPRP